MREECQAWKFSPDPYQQLQYRVDFPRLDMAGDRRKLELFELQQVRKDVDREARATVQPEWDRQYREAWKAIEAAATGPLFEAVSQWEQLVATRAAGITVPCGLPSEWHTAAILELVRIALKELHLDDR